MCHVIVSLLLCMELSIVSMSILTFGAHVILYLGSSTIGFKNYQKIIFNINYV